MTMLSLCLNTIIDARVGRERCIMNEVDVWTFRCIRCPCIIPVPLILSSSVFICHAKRNTLPPSPLFLSLRAALLSFVIPALIHQLSSLRGGRSTFTFNSSFSPNCSLPLSPLHFSCVETTCHLRCMAACWHTVFSCRNMESGKNISQEHLRLI